jgi:hypothetical protein
VLIPLWEGAKKEGEGVGVNGEGGLGGLELRGWESVGLSDGGSELSRSGPNKFDGGKEDSI